MLRFFSIGLLLVTTTAANAAVVVTVLPNLGVPLGSEGSYPIDFDGDGIYEVNFVASGGSQFSAFNNSHVRLQAIPSDPPNVGSRAISLNLGSLVGSTPQGSSVLYDSRPGGSLLRFCTDAFCVGNWPSGTFVTTDPNTGFLTIFPESGYLGVEFTNSSGVHYGWVDVGVLGFFPAGRIYGWGWETQAGVAVQIVPEPSTVLLMTAGVMAAAFQRRRQENQEA
jgi:PEP-CTERM motif